MIGTIAGRRVGGDGTGRRATAFRVFALMLTATLAGPATAPGAAAASAPVTTVAVQDDGPAPPDTPAGRQLGWLLSASDQEPLPEFEVEEHFFPTYLAGIGGPAAFNELLATLGGTLELEEVLLDTTDQVRAVTNAGETYRFLIHLRVDDTGLIDWLLFSPYPSSWDELDQTLATLAPQASFAVSRIDADGRCETVHAVGGQVTRPLASVYKLYVLGALAHAVDTGAMSWDDPLAIRDEWKILQAGGMVDLPAGRELPLREYADQMISVSDNTATDHLIHHLGRDAVEAQLDRFGNDHTEANTPLLTTRELFTLKGFDYPELADRYIAADAENRLAILRSIATVPLEQIQPWTDRPRKINEIEWFGSAEDVCRAYAGLWRQAQRADLAPISRAMSLNDGLIGLHPSQFPVIWHKNGLEVGVADYTYLVQTADGDVFVCSVLLADPAAPLAAGAVDLNAIALARAGIRLAVGPIGKGPA